MAYSEIVMNESIPLLVKIYEMEWPYRCPYTNKIEKEFRWFWEDDYCEEPIGPFLSEAEARRDFEEVREVES